MISIEDAKFKALQLLRDVQVPLTRDEQLGLLVNDFGLGDISTYGVQVLEYVNNDRYCARQLVLLPRQTIPAHMHPPVGNDPGKVETFRVIWGRVWAYTEGEPSKDIVAELRAEDQQYFSGFHQIELNPGQQCTIGGNQHHWFQAGDEGAVVIEISSTARDQFDVFMDPRVVISGIPQAE